MWIFLASSTTTSLVFCSVVSEAAINTTLCYQPAYTIQPVYVSPVRNILIHCVQALLLTRSFHVSNSVQSERTPHRRPSDEMPHTPRIAAALFRSPASAHKQSTLSISDSKLDVPERRRHRGRSSVRKAARIGRPVSTGHGRLSRRNHSAIYTSDWTPWQLYSRPEADKRSACRVHYYFSVYWTRTTGMVIRL